MQLNTTSSYQGIVTTLSNVKPHTLLLFAFAALIVMMPDLALAANSKISSGQFGPTTAVQKGSTKSFYQYYLMFAQWALILTFIGVLISNFLMGGRFNRTCLFIGSFVVIGSPLMMFLADLSGFTSFAADVKG
ncbi:MAG: hypothetical protein V3T17_09885 [Pseudomonadales bacterium]